MPLAMVWQKQPNTEWYHWQWNSKSSPTQNGRSDARGVFQQSRLEVVLWCRNASQPWTLLYNNIALHRHVARASKLRLCAMWCNVQRCTVVIFVVEDFAVLGTQLC
ncbi:hypothetical protein DUNSADRAFT_12683 [Dunaliella salina]|uniref:Encoded protein n=1 Tax=Dunaliella salina TaxID=3046 RepID=A0ABQ7GAV8_DUNSA|nr:hypothetical protein DUNSADRAFT_12683 [Dunaliella salina]|eukprot:KAF5831736.1 hypothetical protein DUNSADRAFT_12683 [Dunaliella salina]